ncbi:Hsp20/alpha crystallin family protein [Nesterenkonia lutea]|uniref:HSP20 family protein n=1 Tax=Nesterenkonia lutea TaxID=272919 RepID=A0ABR9JGS0_9MICC|nr:Hsp20 family protein [Nesterenkonia lutea]MBE1524985.1 HSP20 family protein [Nesterenkonia lutea]
MPRTLLRCIPFSGLDNMCRDLRGKSPTIDVYTAGDEDLVIEAHLHNYSHSDVAITVDRGNLLIHAERQDQDDQKPRSYLIRESSSSFYRSISLPGQADPALIPADFKEGILRGVVPLRRRMIPAQSIAIGSGRSFT